LANRDQQEVCDDIRKGGSYLGVILDAAKCGRDVVTEEVYGATWENDADVVDTGEESIQCSSVLNGSLECDTMHEIDWNGVVSRTKGMIDNKTVLSTGFDDNTDRRNMKFWYKRDDPSREGDYECLGNLLLNEWL
jgi:hypothetical protein